MSRQYFEGESIFIPHPTPNYEITTRKISNGEVNIVKYSDGTVIVLIAEQGKSPYTWVNRSVEYDPVTKTARIIPENN